MGSGIENGISSKYMAALYILSGFGGNLLSSVLNPSAVGVGASTSVFGLIGYYLQYIFTHWIYMGYDKTDGPQYQGLQNQNVK
jgi:membrane associated rhomboid family serine protease